MAEVNKCFQEILMSFEPRAQGNWYAIRLVLGRNWINDDNLKATYKRRANNGLCLALEDWSDEVLIHANQAIRRADTPEARKKAEDEWDVHFKTVDQLFTGKKFIFDRMTLAGISIFSQLHYLYTVVNYDIPARYKNVNAFMELMRQTLKLESLSDSFEAKSL